MTDHNTIPHMSMKFNPDRDSTKSDDNTQRTCQNCGSHVTKRYARCRSVPGEVNPRCCPWCPDKVWDADGRAREARAGAQKHQTR